MKNELLLSSSDSSTETDLLLKLKMLLETEPIQGCDENLRIKKLLEEGKVETVYQILSHRKAVASVKNAE